jgi:hypothetical protein
MNVILQIVQQRKTLVALIGGGILGLVLGLVYAWMIQPVEYYNATPGNLRSDFRENYILWVAAQYNQDGNQEEALKRLGAEFWDKEELVKVLDRLIEKHGGAEATHLRALKAILGGAPAVTPAESGGAGGLASSVFKICGSALLLVACVALVVFLVSRIRAQRAAPQVVDRGLVARVPVEQVSWGAEGPPLVQFTTSYALGDDHYDPSFSIEMENGEFMGECGVSISETIGVGSPSKVTAFEVWLFDKSDIRTVTRVLMSDYAFNDEAMKAKLSPKGEPTLATQGKDAFLETKTLRIRARIAEMEYGVGDSPSNSFFEKFKVDLAVWVLPEQEGAQVEVGDDMRAMPPVL